MSPLLGAPSAPEPPPPGTGGAQPTGGLALAGGGGPPPPPPPSSGAYGTLPVTVTAAAAGTSTAPPPPPGSTTGALALAARFTASAQVTGPPPPPTGDHATVWVISDSQDTSSAYVTARVNAAGAWVNANTANISYLAELGDNTNDNTAAEWTVYNGNYSRWGPFYSAKTGGKSAWVHGSASHVPWSSYVTHFGTPPSGRESWSFDIPVGTYGSWHCVMIKSDPALTTSDADYAWVQADLAANASKPTLCMWHVPRWDSGSRHTSNSSPAQQPLIDLLHRSSQVEFTVHGHVHQYHAYRRMNASGGDDTVNGIRQFIVTNAGQCPTTGAGYTIRAITPWPAVIGNGNNLGPTEFRLYRDHYEWATAFAPSYSQAVSVLSGPGTVSSTRNGDSGTQTIRHPF